MLLFFILGKCKQEISYLNLKFDLQDKSLQRLNSKSFVKLLGFAPIHVSGWRRFTLTDFKFNNPVYLNSEMSRVT